MGARVCKNLFIGPDGSVDGDTGYNAQRLGGFAKYTFALTKDIPLKLTLVTGHQFVSGSGDSSGGGGGRVRRRRRHLCYDRPRRQLLRVELWGLDAGSPRRFRTWSRRLAMERLKCKEIRLAAVLYIISEIANWCPSVFPRPFRS